MDALAELLRRNKWFAALPAAELDPLVQAFSIDDYPDGHVFMHEGRRADGAFVILSGEVVVTRIQGSRQREVNRLHAGDLFGIVALLDDEPRSASCTAAGPVRAAWLPQTAFHLMLNADAPCALAVQHAVAEQLCADFRHLQSDLRKRMERGA